MCYPVPQCDNWTFFQSYRLGLGGGLIKKIKGYASSRPCLPLGLVGFSYFLYLLEFSNG